ncbi:MAG: Response regulator rcp1 [Spirosoma sp.]|nr:Response regulator rcp1 [Spirosoma sp.]
MVYVVDDAQDYRFLVQQVFKLFLPQYPLRLFADGMDLIQAIESGNDLPGAELPKLILLDVDMPKLSGPQTLERLKQHTVWQSVPVVMMSNRMDDSFVSACYQRGACSFLVKPMDLGQLKQIMTLLCHYWLDLNKLPKSLVEPTAGSIDQ